ncbi:UNVERIFIED_CONTAM: hypothetical protein LK11_06170 [Mumia flava]
MHESEVAAYRGPCVLVAPDRGDGAPEPVTAQVTLSGFVQPIDGAYHWQGRLQPDEQVTALAARVGRKPLAVHLPGGDPVTARLGERNPWGGYRISGTGTPPYISPED